MKRTGWRQVSNFQMNLRPTILGSLILCFGVSTGWAAPITWTLQGVALSDGQTLTGSFDYDVSTNTFSNISIANSGNISHPAATWDTKLAGNWGSWTGVYFTSGPSAQTDKTVSIDWVGSLTNAGGTLALATHASARAFWRCGYYVDFNDENTFSYQNCDGSQNALRSGSAYSPLVVSGSISAVPVPAAAWLFGGALGALGWLRKRQTTA